MVEVFGDVELDNTLLIAVIAIVVLALVVFLFVRRKPGTRVDAPETHESTVGQGGAIAIEDVAGEFLGVDVTPELKVVEEGEPDDLTVLKGLGPKAAARLNALGITRYSQLAALSGSDLDVLDAKMETFKGRLVRDRWVEQAGHLASGDRVGFEEKFGKLG
ncbi:hypothetical protein [Sphingomonas sp. ID0503]|uniref:hypothetical protein n=1 Tax=Sphingomonas sp. ID0503 TaxID=3399691 RepID=UPI003AFB73DF